ncbi:MAG: response regulator [Verrucomicrobia bacterium]|nr:response regulator [Verrucomicrobiota bacterium]
MSSAFGKILIVDDCDIVRESVSPLAHALGYIPVSVSSGPDALKEISEGGFSVVLLDYDLNGATVAKVAREADPNVRIIGMSALGEYVSRFLSSFFQTETIRFI